LCVVMVYWGLCDLFFVSFVFVMFWCHCNYRFCSNSYECCYGIGGYVFLCCDQMSCGVCGHGLCRVHLALKGCVVNGS